jgi:hypothetical protein
MGPDVDFATRAIIEYELAKFQEAEIEEDGTLYVIRHGGSVFRAPGIGDLLIGTVIAEAEAALKQ